ncbi:NAD(P)-dependent oxidoreductase [Falsihalocynthiibacter sp. BN13B15]|uniref:NAD(P)-dependent oxidoreductase n=1 Tax=Falsihalocynthiibacter sp. BN13B15 TaxID=3240871 RepID=UPI00350FD19E
MGIGNCNHNIGWIGAGKMGGPMIQNLLGNSAQVCVIDPDADAVAAAIGKGATAGASLDDMAGKDIVFSTLPNDQALMSVVSGTPSKMGLADVLAKGAIFVDMSTVSPDVSSKVAKILEKAKISYLRAPLSGSTVMAENATLTILASGDEDAWQTVLPYLEMMSKRQFYLGAEDEARYMKLVINTLVGGLSALLAEALSLGGSGGLTRASMMEVIGESAVASPLLTYKTETVVADDFNPAFTVLQMIKDFTLISDAARLNGVPLLTTGLILEQYRAAANAGLKDADFFALVKWHSNMSSQ